MSKIEMKSLAKSSEAAENGGEKRKAKKRAKNIERRKA
jgi:hypothetical protein